MAIGLPASYTGSADLGGSRQAAREVIRSVMGLLGWEYSELHADLFIAKIPVSGSSWGERITVTLESPGRVVIKSSCLDFQVFDWGKNKKNVNDFLQRYHLREPWLVAASSDPGMIDSDGTTPLQKVIDPRSGGPENGGK